MPINGEQRNMQEDGQDKDAFVVTFTNGALEQLNDLRAHYKQPNLNEVIKLGISLLQQFKEKDGAVK